jgi:WD40 repeat protein
MHSLRTTPPAVVPDMARLDKLSANPDSNRFEVGMQPAGRSPVRQGVVAAALSAVLFPVRAAQRPVNAERPAAQDGVKPAPEPRPVVVREDGHVRHLAWSPDGKVLATVALGHETVKFTDGDGNRTGRGGPIPHSTIKLWDATTGKLKRSLGEEKDTSIAAIAFSADGKTVAVSTSKHVLTKDPKTPLKTEVSTRVMDAQTWALKHKVTADGSASALAFSPDGTRLAFGCRARLAGDAAFVRLWDVQKQKRIGGTEGGGYRVSCLAFSPDGKLLAAGDENGKVPLEARGPASGP